MTPASWGALLGARGRGRAAAGRVPGRGHPPAAAGGPGAALRPRPAAGRPDARACGRVVVDLGRRRGLRAARCARRRRRRAGARRRARPSAAGSSAPGSTRRSTSSGSSRWCGGWSASRSCAAVRPARGRSPARGGAGAVAAALRARLRASACSPATTASPPRSTDRERRILAEFPTVAELLALAVAAGESPVAALDRVVRRSGGELSADLGRVLAAVRTGDPVALGLRRAGRRAPACRWSPGSPRASRSRSSAAPRSPTCCTPRPPTSARPAAAS